MPSWVAFMKPRLRDWHPDKNPDKIEARGMSRAPRALRKTGGHKNGQSCPCIRGKQHLKESPSSAWTWPEASTPQFDRHWKLATRRLKGGRARPQAVIAEVRVLRARRELNLDVSGSQPRKRPRSKEVSSTLGRTTATMEAGLAVPWCPRIKLMGMVQELDRRF